MLTAKGDPNPQVFSRYVCEQLETILLEPATSTSGTVPSLCTDILQILDSALASTAVTHYLSWLNFCEMMKDVTSDIGLLSIATRRLHGVGELFFDPEKIKGIVITDMVWFYNDVLGWLFDPPTLLPMALQVSISIFKSRAENGPVKKSDIPDSRIFQDLSIDMLDVLESFEICYGFEQAGVKMYVFPSLLRTQPIRSLWLKQDIFTVHLGLKFVCSKRTLIIPTGFFQRLQVRIRLDIGPKFSPSAFQQTDSIWGFGTICKLDNAIALVRLAPDHGSIFVHVRGDSESSSDVRALMQRIVKVIQNKQVKFPGLSLNIDHCIYSDLNENILDPQTIPQGSVQIAREKGARAVFNVEGAVESMAQLLAFDYDGKRLR